jgi:hypothetical protein
MAAIQDPETIPFLVSALKENNTGTYFKWSHLGAQDAVEYYNSVDGKFEELKKSYDWAWLASYALLKRNLIPDQ